MVKSCKICAIGSVSQYGSASCTTASLSLFFLFFSTVFSLLIFPFMMTLTFIRRFSLFRLYARHNFLSPTTNSVKLVHTQNQIKRRALCVQRASTLVQPEPRPTPHAHRARWANIQGQAVSRVLNPATRVRRANIPTRLAMMMVDSALSVETGDSLKIQVVALVNRVPRGTTPMGQQREFAAFLASQVNLEIHVKSVPLGGIDLQTPTTSLVASNARSAMPSLKWEERHVWQ